MLFVGAGVEWAASTSNESSQKYTLYIRSHKAYRRDEQKRVELCTSSMKAVRNKKIKKSFPRVWNGRNPAWVVTLRTWKLHRTILIDYRENERHHFLQSVVAEKANDLVIAFERELKLLDFLKDVLETNLKSEAGIITTTIFRVVQKIMRIL